MGGYFFLLLQTLITRLITLTMRIQNWKNSENVTIITGPPFYVSEGTKRRFTLRKCSGKPPACRLSVAPSWAYHILSQKATPPPTGSGVLFDKFFFLRYNDLARMGGRDDTIHGRRFGWHFRKEVNANAYYVTYWSLYGYNHCKKTWKPPLWQVTVFLEIF